MVGYLAMFGPYVLDGKVRRIQDGVEFINLSSQIWKIHRLDIVGKAMM